MIIFYKLLLIYTNNTVIVFMDGQVYIKPAL